MLFPLLTSPWLLTCSQLRWRRLKTRNANWFYLIWAGRRARAHVFILQIQSHLPCNCRRGEREREYRRLNARWYGPRRSIFPSIVLGAGSIRRSCASVSQLVQSRPSAPIGHGGTDGEIGEPCARLDLLECSNTPNSLSLLLFTVISLFLSLSLSLSLSLPT